LYTLKKSSAGLKITADVLKVRKNE